MILRTIRKVFNHFGEQNVNWILPVTQFYSAHRTLSHNTAVTAPVKLAYASYESMKGRERAASPIVIMHGLFGSKNNWNNLSKSIHQKTERKVITVDARNHGDSPHSADMTYKHMSEDVVQLLTDLGIAKTILIGHSMGGRTMMYTALNFSEMIEKLIVVDISPVGTIPSNNQDISTIFKVMRSIKLEGSPSLTKARKMAEEQLVQVVKKPALCQFLIMNLVEAEAGKYKWRINLPVLEENFHTNLAKFPLIHNVYMGPTLFIGGSNSDFIKVEDHNAIKKLFPRAEFHYIVGANHWVHADNPSEFLKIVTNFINQNHS